MANMGIQGDPDWIITVAGQPVMEVTEWEFIDDEKDQSQIKIAVPNPEMTNSGKFKYGDEMDIRFGYVGQLSPKAHLPVAEVKECYATGKAMTIEVIGRDESSKMSGGNNKGNQGKADDAKQLRKTIEANGMKMDGNAKGENSGCKGSCYNESDKALAYRWANSMSAAGQMEAGGGGAAGPTSPLSNESDSNMEGSDATRHGGHTHSSASRWSGDGKGGGRDKNRGKNHDGQKGQEPVTGKLELRGFPTLRAKATVTILGVGPAASGTYYVKKVTHSWKENQGYKTVADLTRGGTGKGGVGGTSPMVMYSDIWKKGSMYVGPRKTNDSPQTTFTYGDGTHLINFEMHIKPQPQRGGGEPKKPSKGMGIDLRKKLEAYEESAGSSAVG
jgi:hypothetical protein